MIEEDKSNPWNKDAMQSSYDAWEDKSLPPDDYILATAFRIHLKTGVDLETIRKVSYFHHADYMERLERSLS